MTVLKLKRKIVIQFSAFQHVVQSTNFHKREDGFLLWESEGYHTRNIYYRNAFYTSAHFSTGHAGCIWSVTKGDAFRKACTNIHRTALWQH